MRDHAHFGGGYLKLILGCLEIRIIEVPDKRGTDNQGSTV